jgi:hypothetical protein
MSKSTRAILVAFIGGGFALAVVWFGFYLNHSSGQGVSPTSAPSSPAVVTQTTAPASSPSAKTQAPSTKAVAIRINPKSRPVKMCESFSGPGDVPEGRYLWIVVKTNENGHTFYFNDASAAGGRWSAPAVTVGSKDPKNEKIRFPVLAVTFNATSNRKIASGRYRDTGVPELFPDKVIHDQIGVERGANNTPC